MVGQILGNRYELLEKIGGGGMAEVYKAKCRLLNRFVAVKILRSDFTNDEEFVKRFIIEAQSAASLSHPNIVPIYDVGKDDNIHYIVMEFINGITLKQHVVNNGHLEWEEAINVSIQVCSAIEHAHKNNIVHRDIKPHNILMTEDGVAKVTDFGIARAITSSTITMVGSTIGSVHYFSPEQARGGYIDEKSDLYSLGIALYEMVTGRLPYDGDTPVAVALKHIQDIARAPKEINENIPDGINEIINKAIRKDQNRRYQNASEMLRDLYRVLEEPEGGFIEETNLEDSPTKRMPALNTQNYKIEEGENVDDVEEGETKKGNIFTYFLAVATSIVIFGVFAVIFMQLFGDGPEQNNYIVPDFGGRKIAEVKNELLQHGIKTKERYVNNDNYEKDIIISQNPAPADVIRLKTNNIIEFEVSDGPQTVKIPNFRGIEERIASSDLKGKDMLVVIEEEYSDDIPEGLIIRTVPPADSEVKPGSYITIFKSLGEEIESTIVPDLIGKTMTEAKKLLSEANLAQGNVIPDEDIRGEKIIEQSPEAGEEVDEKTYVDIVFEDTEPEIKYVISQVALRGDENYGSRIRVRVIATHSNTGDQQVLVNERKRKDEFPFSIQVPVLKNSQTDVKIYFEDESEPAWEYTVNR